MNVTHPQEKPLFYTALFLATLFWLGLLWLGLFLLNKWWPQAKPLDVAMALMAVSSVLGILYSLVTVLRIARLRGYAVELSKQQFPDLHNRLHSVCQRLEIDPAPMAYLLRDRNAPDTDSLNYLGVSYLALNANLINALTERQGAIDFVMGHELGRLNHHFHHWDGYLWPVRILPLLGPAWARTQVYVRDRHGLAACKTKADAAFALATMAAGDRRWKSLSIPDFAAQSAHNRIFSMSYAELISARPWLSKRMASLRALSTNSENLLPQRNVLAWLAAMLTPYIGWNQPGLVMRLVLLVLWLAAGSHAYWTGERHLVQAGWLPERLAIGQRFVPYSAPQPKTAPAKPAAEPAPPPEPDTNRADNPYRRLEADLRLLGRFARERQAKHGGIPCEIGNIHALSLNYPAKRYAFSCDEPRVYTIVERGEFEPGRTSYIHTYDWKLRKFILGPSEGSQ